MQRIYIYENGSAIRFYFGPFGQIGRTVVFCTRPDLPAYVTMGTHEGSVTERDCGPAALIQGF